MYKCVDVKDVFRITEIYTSFKRKIDNDYSYAGEYHSFREMLIVTDGVIGVNSNSNVFILKKGQGIIHEPMEFHRLWNEGDSCSEIIVFSFDAENMIDGYEKIFEPEKLEAADEILSLIEKHFNKNNATVVSVKAPERADYQIIVKKLETFILENLSHGAENLSAIKSRSAKNYSMAVNVLKNNLDKSLSVTEIAQMCNMSEVNLKCTFSRYSGMGVISYFNHLKIRTAIDMMKNGMTAKETAYKLSFANQNYFSTVFKRVTGLSPKKYFEINEAIHKKE